MSGRCYENAHLPPISTKTDFGATEEEERLCSSPADARRRSGIGSIGSAAATTLSDEMRATTSASAAPSFAAEGTLTVVLAATAGGSGGVLAKLTMISSSLSSLESLLIPFYCGSPRITLVSYLMRIVILSLH